MVWSISNKSYKAYRILFYLYLHPLNADSLYLLLAPGETMFRSAKMYGREPPGPMVASSMIEYLRFEEPASMQMRLAVIMMVWET